MENKLTKEVADLKRKIEALEDSAKKNPYQLQYPLDVNTQDIINDHKLVFERNATGTITADKTLVISINGTIYQINAL